MIDAAVQYAELLGLALFPVAADCRVPIRAEGWFEHGVHDASKDPVEIAKRWKAYPAANIAVACGMSGLFGLDVDVKPGGANGLESLAAMERRFGPLPTTWRSATPSGGLHIWFRQPADRELRNRVNTLAFHRPDGSIVERYPALDVRAAHGSLAAPPSAKPSGPYRWIDDPGDVDLADAPAWLLDIIDPPLPPPKPLPPIRVDNYNRTAKYVAAAVDGECSELARMGAGTGRNLRLFQAAANLGQFVGAGLLPQGAAESALEQAASECGLWKEDGPHACRGSIRSGMAKGLKSPREVRS